MWILAGSVAMAYDLDLTEGKIKRGMKRFQKVTGGKSIKIQTGGAIQFVRIPHPCTWHSAPSLRGAPGSMDAKAAFIAARVAL